MERDFEEGNEQKTQKLAALDPDLAQTIAMNLILERLELVDHIRFSAVCKKWLSIQKIHRIRNSPYPPPLPLPFPWLRCLRCSFDYDKEVDIVFHLPGKQKTYNIRLPKPYKRHIAFDCRHGWQILVLDQSLCIFNPITGVQIELPSLSELVHSSYVLPISHPPYDPDCTVIMLNFDGKAYMNRLNSNSGWKTIQCQCLKLNRDVIVFCHNKIYCMKDCKRVWMIDTLLSDLVGQMIEMDCSEISAFELARFWLVDHFGELVMVAAIYEGKSIGTGYVKEFEVYRADFSMNKWVRMELLGEYAMFFSLGSRFSTSTVDVGCKKNTIYCTSGIVGDELPSWDPDFSTKQWRAFDLNTKEWINGPAMSELCNHTWNGGCSWFLPALDYFGVDKRDGACQIQSG